MFKTLGIIVAVALAGLLLFAATRADDLRVERKLVIAAPPERLYPLINDLHNFNRWNPYLAKDLALKGSYEGPNAGPGAKYSWKGNKDVGTGSMEIKSNTEPKLVVMRLLFVEPFAGDNVLEFGLKPAGDGRTEVSWTMHGPQAYVSKLMGVFISMDKMIGADFETGLANLRKVAEAP